MKRFLVFGGDRYYPGGGWDDFLEDFDTKKEAQSYVMTRSLDWLQIIDTQIPHEKIEWIHAH